MTTHKKRKAGLLTPEGKRAIVAASGFLLAAAGAAVASCHPDAVENFCRGVLMRQMPRELQPGQKAPPCGLDGVKFAVSDGCWAEASKRAAPDGDCGENLADDPDGKGRCFAILPAHKPGRKPAALQSGWLPVSSQRLE